MSKLQLLRNYVKFEFQELAICTKRDQMFDCKKAANR